MFWKIPGKFPGGYVMFCEVCDVLESSREVPFFGLPVKVPRPEANRREGVRGAGLRVLRTPGLQ